MPGLLPKQALYQAELRPDARETKRFEVMAQGTGKAEKRLNTGGFLEGTGPERRAYSVGNRSRARSAASTRFRTWSFCKMLVM